MVVLRRKQPGFEIDQRVSIGLDALQEPDQRAIGEILSDREHFLAATAERECVPATTEGRPYYTLSMPSGLQIIYTREGDLIQVIDLVRQETLDYFRASKLASRQSGKSHRPPQD